MGTHYSYLCTMIKANKLYFLSVCRWIFWILTIFSGACLVLIILTIPETHHPSILRRMAEEKRAETGDARWHAHVERAPKISFGSRCRGILLKPWQVFFAEPMLIAITVYLSFIYGCLVSQSILSMCYVIVNRCGCGCGSWPQWILFLIIGGRRLEY